MDDASTVDAPAADAPGADGTTTPVSPRRRSQGRLAIVGGVISAVLVIGALGGTWLVTRESAAASGSDADRVGAATPTPTPTPTPSPTVPPVAATVPANYDFQSPSGNLRCSGGQFSGKPGAICQQASINYAVPAGACPSPFYPEGVFVGVDTTGPYWPCVGAWIHTAEVMPYDSPVTHFGITCSINYDTGVTCVNEKGKGFSMEYDAGVALF